MEKKNYTVLNKRDFVCFFWDSSFIFWFHFPFPFNMTKVKEEPIAVTYFLKLPPTFQTVGCKNWHQIDGSNNPQDRYIAQRLLLVKEQNLYYSKLMQLWNIWKLQTETNLNYKYSIRRSIWYLNDKQKIMIRTISSLQQYIFLVPQFQFK